MVKYRDRPELIALTEAVSRKMLKEVQALEGEAKKVAAEAQSAPPAKKEQMARSLATVQAKMRAATAALQAARQRLSKAKQAAQPRDIADVLVCEPFTIRVQPVEKK